MREEIYDDFPNGHPRASWVRNFLKVERRQEQCRHMLTQLAAKAMQAENKNLLMKREQSQGVLSGLSSHRSKMKKNLTLKAQLPDSKIEDEANIKVQEIVSLCILRVYERS